MIWAVVGKRIDHAQSFLDVIEGGNTPHPLAQILLPGRRLQHQLVEAAGKEMIERIDIAHAMPIYLDRPTIVF